LIGFEMFNFSTTEVALKDLLGDTNSLGVSWATILTIAFCGIDFAGIARLFAPEENQPGSSDAWYLLGAWLIAATMNAVLTWWGISLALVNRQPQAASFIDEETITGIIPVFVAIMVWVTRILLIGSFSAAWSRIFSDAAQKQKTVADDSWAGSLQDLPVRSPAPQPLRQPAMSVNSPRPKPANRPQRRIGEPEYVSDPSYAASTTTARNGVEKKETGRSENRQARF
jgi:hypothetical protein